MKWSRPTSPDRKRQFLYIGRQREDFARQGQPVISVDTKKKELIGAFQHSGAQWDREPVLVNDHDFRSDADGLAIPYGTYDTQANRGTVCVGNSHDTPAFAAWASAGRHCRAWNKALQDRLCNPYDLTVTVSHSPPGASKWNPIEHRLFSEISKNWAGEPLTSLEKMLNFIGTTTTESGLAVNAYLIQGALPHRRESLRSADASTLTTQARDTRSLELHFAPFAKSELILGQALSSLSKRPVPRRRLRRTRAGE